MKWSFISDVEFGSWIWGGSRRVKPAANGTSRVGRGLSQALQADVALIQRECLPLGTPILERALGSRTPFVWDVDDALWQGRHGLKGRLRGGPSKYEWLAQNAQMVWAGSANTAQWSLDHGARRVEIVPTTTPLPSHVSNPVEPRRLVWVGTQSTAPFIEELLHALAADLSAWDIQLVGARISIPDGLNVRQFAWSRHAEEAALEGAWVGLYPIDTLHPLASGKSASKASLYSAFGVPCIATRTRSTADVVTHGKTGLLVDSLGAWRAALRELSDPAIRDRMAGEARGRAERDFNPQTWGKVCADWLKSIAAGDDVP